MVDFIEGSIQFMVKYLPQIMLMVIILVLVMVYMVVHNVHFVKMHPHLERVVEIEGFGDKEMAMHLCKQNRGDKIHGGEPNCNKLSTKFACNASGCCGWAVLKDETKKPKCVAVTVHAGQPLGMTHRTNANEVDALYFKGKKINI